MYYRTSDKWSRPQLNSGQKRGLSVIYDTKWSPDKRHKHIQLLQVIRNPQHHSPITTVFWIHIVVMNHASETRSTVLDFLIVNTHMNYIILSTFRNTVCWCEVCPQCYASTDTPELCIFTASLLLPPSPRYCNFCSVFNLSKFPYSRYMVHRESYGI